MIYDLATDEEKQILEETYSVRPFFVKTIALERIFVDKLFAAEAYVRNADKPNKAFEAAKHIYDLSVLEKHPQIVSLMKNTEALKSLLAIRMKEEQQRLDGIPNVLPKDFTFFKQTSKNTDVKKAYDIMQRQYVMRKCDTIDFNIAMESLNNIYHQLFENSAWSECEIHIE